MTSNNLVAATGLGQDKPSCANDKADLVKALRPEADQLAAYAPGRWRTDCLPLLEGIGPLLPGAADKRPTVGKEWEQQPGWSIARLQAAKPECICWHIGADALHVGVDVDGTAPAAFCQSHGCDPYTADTWRIIRTGNTERVKLVFTVTPEQRAALVAGNKTVKFDGKELAVFAKPGTQIVVLGNHYTKESHFTENDDQYAWAGRAPSDAQPMPPEWFALLTGVFCGDRPLKPATRRTISPKNTHKSNSSEWESSSQGRPCPICGRDHSGACAIHRDGDSVWCYHGENNYPPDCAKSGGIITGTDGRSWAYVRDEDQDPFGERSLFVIDKPRERSQEPEPTDAELLEGFEVVPGGYDLKAAISGMDAITAALGTGWHGKENEPAKRAARACGDISRKLQIALGDRLAFDEMNMLPALDGEPLKPSEIDLLHVRLSENGWKISQQSAIDGLMLAAQRNSFHPVRQYLQALEHNPEVVPFDLDQVAPRFFRAHKPLYVAMVRAWLIGAVARALQPGCHMDYCLVLQSDQQGIGKSTGFEALASPDWFCCSLPESDKDFLLNVHNSWIYELAELEAVTGKKESGSLKALITTKIDKFRPPYGKGIQAYPRQSVFCGTVNQREFLRDSTGNRRYWVVPIDGTDKLDTEGLRQQRDGIWKAAVLAWRAGERPMLPDELAKESEAQNEEFNTQDPWVGMLQAWMNGAALVRWDEDRDPSLARPDQFGGFSTAEALYSAGLKRPEQISRADEMRVAPLLRQLGFSKERRCTNGTRAHAWVPAQPPAQPAQPLPNLKATGWAGQTTCTDAGSQPSAQPAQPIFRKRVEKIEAVEQGAAAPAPPASATKSPFVAKKVGQVGQPPDPCCAAMDLSCPTSFFEVGQVGQVGQQVGQPLYEEGDEVELLTEGTWVDGWRITVVVEASGSTRYRIECNTDYKVVGPDRIRLSNAALGI